MSEAQARFEYKIAVGGSMDDPAATLNAAAAEGWRVVGMAAMGGMFTWTMERPVRAAPPAHEKSIDVLEAERQSYITELAGLWRGSTLPDRHMADVLTHLTQFGSRVTLSYSEDTGAWTCDWITRPIRFRSARHYRGTRLGAAASVLACVIAAVDGKVADE